MPKGIPKRTLLVLALGVAVLVSGILVLISVRTATAPTSLGSRDIPVEGSSRGRQDARVTVVEYADFQCPYCAQFALGTYRQLEETYVKGGQVRWVFRHFAFLGRESQWAAEATECAGEQGYFWPYHDKLFASQAGENRGSFSPDRLKALARELGLGREAFDACLDSGRQAGKVQQDTEEGRRLGVRATPTFFVDGKKLEGAQPYLAFQSAIEEALTRKP